MRKSFAKDGITFDPKVIDALYSPSIGHLAYGRKESDEFNVYRIKVGDVVVRFTEDSFSVDMVVEGKLPDATLAALIVDLCDKLGRLENTKYITIHH